MGGAVRSSRSAGRGRSGPSWVRTGADRGQEQRPHAAGAAEDVRGTPARRLHATESSPRGINGGVSNDGRWFADLGGIVELGRDVRGGDGGAQAEEQAEPKDGSDVTHIPKAARLHPANHPPRSKVLGCRSAEAIFRAEAPPISVIRDETRGRFRGGSPPWPLNDPRLSRNDGRAFWGQTPSIASSTTKDASSRRFIFLRRTVGFRTTFRRHETQRTIFWFVTALGFIAPNPTVT